MRTQFLRHLSISWVRPQTREDSVEVWLFRLITPEPRWSAYMTVGRGSQADVLICLLSRRSLAVLHSLRYWTSKRACCAKAFVLAPASRKLEWNVSAQHSNASPSTRRALRWSIASSHSSNSSQLGLVSTNITRLAGSATAQAQALRHSWVRSSKSITDASNIPLLQGQQASFQEQNAQRIVRRSKHLPMPIRSWSEKWGTAMYPPVLST